MTIGLCLLLLTGCLERQERIVIDGDGNANIWVLVKSQDESDLTDADRFPDRGGGWEVRKRQATTPDGKAQFEIAAHKYVSFGSRLPVNYADRGDSNTAAYLQFPTDLTVERRGNAWYYHFHRSYTPRQYAQIGALQDIVTQQTQGISAKQAAGQPLDPLEQKNLAEILVKFSTQRFEVFARQAFQETCRTMPQDAWLNVHAALADLTKNVDYDTMASMMTKAQKDDKTDLYDQLAKQLDAAAYSAIIQALSDTGAYFDAGAFSRRYRFHQFDYKVTEDIGDDKFHIEVVMPGEIVGSNADSTSGNTATWDFPGKMLYDRTVELMVTSRVLDQTGGR